MSRASGLAPDNTTASGVVKVAFACHKRPRDASFRPLDVFDVSGGNDQEAGPVAGDVLGGPFGSAAVASGHVALSPRRSACTCSGVGAQRALTSARPLLVCTRAGCARFRGSTFLRVADHEVARVKALYIRRYPVFPLRLAVMGCDDAGHEYALALKARQLTAYGLDAGPELRSKSIRSPGGRIALHEVQDSRAQRLRPRTASFGPRFGTRVFRLHGADIRFVNGHDQPDPPCAAGLSGPDGTGASAASAVTPAPLVFFAFCLRKRFCSCLRCLLRSLCRFSRR